MIFPLLISQLNVGIPVGVLRRHHPPKKKEMKKEKNSSGEAIIEARPIKIWFHSRRHGVMAITTNTPKEGGAGVSFNFIPDGEDTREGLFFSLMLHLSFLMNEYHYTRSLRCLPSNPLASDYIILAASLKSKENFDPNEDSGSAEGTGLRYLQ